MCAIPISLLLVLGGHFIIDSQTLASAPYTGRHPFDRTKVGLSHENRDIYVYLWLVDHSFGFVCLYWIGV